MGIKGLNVWISANFPGVMAPVRGDKANVYDHIAFDLNGIVHQACRKRGNEREVIKAVISELDVLLRLFPASKTVLIALDGPGPTAKLIEQRKRRIDKVLKAARDAEALIPGSRENLRRLELARLEGRPPPGTQKKKKKKSYDSLQVTPGTLFMMRMRRALEWYAASRLCGIGGLFKGHSKPTMLISAADVAGEGEVKLLSHVHAILGSGRGADTQPPSFLLVGPDADLLLLGLAAGTPRCDVLTMDQNGSHRLFRVRVLCDAFVAKAGGARGAGGLAGTGGAHLGGLMQLDFLVVAFLQGNDYLPKLRGAQLHRMWSKLLRLARPGGEFAGQHLLIPHADRVEINLAMLVRLLDGSPGGAHRDRPAGNDDVVDDHGGGSGARSAVDLSDDPSAKVAAQDGDDDDDDDDDDEEEGMDEDGNEWEYDGDGNGDAASSNRHQGRHRKGNVEDYLHTLAWCAAMYLSGSCPDYTCAYSAAAAPSAAQIGEYHRELIGKQGADARPAYIMPPLNRQGTQPIGTPDVFCLCLLPAAAAQYLPAPLQALMDPSSPLADIFHSNLVWPPNLVARVREAVGSIAPGAYSSEELEAVRAGSVSVWAARGGKPDAVARGCALSPLAASLPSPFGGAKEQLHNPSYVMSGRMPPDESGSSMARWEWRVRQAADKSATPALAPSVSSLFALAGAQSHAPPSQQEPEMASLVAQSLSLNDSVSPPPPSSLPPPPAALLSKLAPARKASPALPGAAPAATSIPAICCAECGKGPNSSPRQGLYLNPPDGNLYCKACWSSYYGVDPPPSARDKRSRW